MLHKYKIDKRQFVTIDAGTFKFCMYYFIEICETFCILHLHTINNRSFSLPLICFHFTSYQHSPFGLTFNKTETTLLILLLGIPNSMSSIFTVSKTLLTG